MIIEELNLVEIVCCPACGWKGLVAEAVLPENDYVACPKCNAPVEKAEAR